jgi:uncharacterized small protein (DUF1192 family)
MYGDPVEKKQRLTMAQQHRVRVHNIMAVLAWGASEIEKDIERREAERKEKEATK